jgi:hypothetical protein
MFNTSNTENFVKIKETEKMEWLSIFSKISSISTHEVNGPSSRL